MAGVEITGWKNRARQNKVRTPDEVRRDATVKPTARHVSSPD
jgi:hypothetical protein